VFSLPTDGTKALLTERPFSTPPPPSPRRSCRGTAPPRHSADNQRVTGFSARTYPERGGAARWTEQDDVGGAGMPETAADRDTPPCLASPRTSDRLRVRRASVLRIDLAPHDFQTCE